MIHVKNAYYLIVLTLSVLNFFFRSYSVIIIHWNWSSYLFSHTIFCIWICLTETVRPEVTLCDWRGVKLQVLTNSLKHWPHYSLDLFLICRIFSFRCSVSSDSAPVVYIFLSISFAAENWRFVTQLTDNFVLARNACRHLYGHDTLHHQHINFVTPPPFSSDLCNAELSLQR